VPVCSQCLPGFLIRRRWKNAQILMVKALRRHDYRRALRLAQSGNRLAEDAVGRVRAELMRSAASWEADARIEMGDLSGAVAAGERMVRRSRHDWTEDSARITFAEALALDGKPGRASRVMDAAIRHALEGGEEKWHTHTWSMLLGAFCLLYSDQEIRGHHLVVLQRLQQAAGMPGTTPRNFDEYRDDVRAWMAKAGKSGVTLRYLGDFPGPQS